jgi:hypothetical protein
MAEKCFIGMKPRKCCFGQHQTFVLYSLAAVFNLWPNFHTPVAYEAARRCHIGEPTSAGGKQEAPAGATNAAVCTRQSSEERCIGMEQHWPWFSDVSC